MASTPKSVTTKLRTLYEVSRVIYWIPRSYIYVAAPFLSDKILVRDDTFLPHFPLGKLYLKDIVPGKRETSLIKLPYPGDIIGIVVLKIGLLFTWNSLAYSN